MHAMRTRGEDPFAAGLLAAALSAAGGCTSYVSPGPPAPICSAPQDSSRVSALVEGDTAFTTALYRAVVAKVPVDQNVVLSPFSVSASLMMVGTGARGNTAAQIQSVLRLPTPAASGAPGFAALACEDETGGSSNGDELDIADSVWVQADLPLQPTFVSTLKDGYGAAPEQADFVHDLAGATRAIDAWVSQETRGKIPNLVASDLPAGTRLVLADAVYFKGAWATAFDPSRTGPGSFTLSDGTVVSVPTMNGENIDVSAGHVTGMNVYELAYRGGGVAMDFLVADPGPSLSDLEASLGADSLGAALASLARPSEKIDSVSLPKFSFSDAFELASTLGGLGLADLFNPVTADLSGIDGMKDLSVGQVEHAALIEVDEQGTIAAAATTETVGLSDFTGVAIDRPFLFFIRNTRTGDILFAGRVEDPRKGP